MGYILQIDTSGEKGMLVLAHSGIVVSKKTIEDSKKQAALINVLIEQLLSESNIEMKQMQAINVIAGPGSYTGLRIGLATAKGICYALDIPLIMQSKLEILSLQQSKGKDFENYGCILKAREKEYFFALYKSNNEEHISPQHITEDAMISLLEKIKIKTLLTTENSILQTIFFDTITFNNHPEIDHVFWSQLSWNYYLEKNFSNLSTSEPYYLKQVFTHK